MAYNFEIGQKLIIELISDDVFEGEFVSGTSTRLELKNCLNTFTQTRDASIQCFYQNEIVALKAFETEEHCASRDDKSLKSTDVPSVSNSPKNNQDIIIKIPEYKYMELKALKENYIYMATRDATYNKATEYLSQCETVGIAILNGDYGRAAPVDLLVLSSWDQVYLFDMNLYNCSHFPRDLKYILECEDIVKVSHNSRELVDCMHYQHAVKVNNIFDTFVAAQMLSDVKFALPECLTFFFNFPNTLIKDAVNDKLKSEWGTRPLTDDLKKKAASNAQYLIFLKNYLQKQLLKEFNDNVQKHSQSTLELSHLDAQFSLGCLDINK